MPPGNEIAGFIVVSGCIKIANALSVIDPASFNDVINEFSELTPRPKVPSDLRAYSLKAILTDRKLNDGI